MKQLKYRNLIEMGYLLADQKWERGYVSRKTIISEQAVFCAGGSRKGVLYVRVPSFSSAQYFIRQYFYHPSASYHKLVLEDYFNE